MTSVIPKAEADRLNTRVQQEIDPRLFLFCNYEPTKSYAISSDATFLTAIQDLYKFSVDSNCVISQFRSARYSDHLSSSIWNQYESLEPTLDLIQSLRAVIDHNTSALNGNVEKQHLQDFKVWIQSVLHKDKPATLQDFAALTVDLQRMAGDIIAFCDQLISDAKARPETDRIQLFQKWTDKTLHWYCHNTKTMIYKGLLIDEYISNTLAAGNGQRIARMDSYVFKMWPLVKRWIDNAYDHQIVMQTNKINQLATRLNSISLQMPAETYAQYQQLLVEWRRELADLQQEQRNYVQISNNNRISYRENVFFDALEKRLKKTMTALDNSGVEYTLLPQSLLQEDISRFFSGAPSGNRHF